MNREVYQKQASEDSEVEVTTDGYIVTLKGTESYGAKPGDSIDDFEGEADIRCISDGSEITDGNTSDDNVTDGNTSDDNVTDGNTSDNNVTARKYK